MGDGNPAVHSFALNTFGHFVCPAAIVALVNKVLKFIWWTALPHPPSSMSAESNDGENCKIFVPFDNWICSAIVRQRSGAHVSNWIVTVLANAVTSETQLSTFDPHKFHTNFVSLAFAEKLFNEVLPFLKTFRSTTRCSLFILISPRKLHNTG